MSKRLKILFITSWFPSNDKPHFGIFIRDWVKAAKIYDDVLVLHLFGQDKHLKKLYSIEKETNRVLTEGLNVYGVRYRKAIFLLNFFPITCLYLCSINCFSKNCQGF